MCTGVLPTLCLWTSIQGTRTLVPTETGRMQLELELQVVVGQCVGAVGIKPSFPGTAPIVLNCKSSFKQPPGFFLKDGQHMMSEVSIMKSVLSINLLIKIIFMHLNNLLLRKSTHRRKFCNLCFCQFLQKYQKLYGLNYLLVYAFTD